MNRKIFVVLTVTMLLVLVTAVAYALTITVDGDREALWLTGSGGQVPGVAADPNEADPVEDQVDISNFRWTNDSSNMYFELETHTSPPRLSLAPFLTQIYICLDIDNNGGTGSAYSNCNNQSGFDRYIYVLGATSVDVQDSTFSSVGSGTLGYNTGTTTPVIEISVPLSALGLGPGVCPPIINAVVYYDNGTVDNDDTTPGAGTITINCGAPTAINLQNIGVSDQSALFPLAVGALLLVLFSVGFVYHRKRQVAA